MGIANRVWEAVGSFFQTDTLTPGQAKVAGYRLGIYDFDTLSEAKRGRNALKDAYGERGCLVSIIDNGAPNEHQKQFVLGFLLMPDASKP